MPGIKSTVDTGVILWCPCDGDSFMLLIRWIDDAWNELDYIFAFLPRAL